MADDPLEAAWRLCRAARPDVVVAVEELRAYVAARRPPDVTDDQLCFDDLCLACACVRGDPAAARAFDREIMPFVDSVLARWDPAVVDDTRQQLLASLLVDHGGHGPMLRTYNGRGALRRWVRVVAAREASRRWRTGAATVAIDDDELFDVLVPPSDPVLSAIKKEAAAVFKAAFITALRELDQRERGALRLHLVQGLTIDEIAPVYSVHRATVARWIASAKQAIVAGTRRHLMRDLALGAVEVDSLIRIVQSGIELSESDWQTER